MIGCILISHGRFGQSLFDVAQEIVGDIPDMYVVSNEGKAPSVVMEEVSSAFDALKNTEGIIILSDLIGSSCWRTGFAALQNQHVPVAMISGVNLGMILSFCQKRNTMSFQELAAIIPEDGRRGITGPTFPKESR